MSLLFYMLLGCLESIWPRFDVLLEKKIKTERMRQIKGSGDDECDQEMKKIWG